MRAAIWFRPVWVVGEQMPAVRRLAVTRIATRRAHKRMLRLKMIRVEVILQVAVIVSLVTAVPASELLGFPHIVRHHVCFQVILAVRSVRTLWTLYWSILLIVVRDEVFTEDAPTICRVLAN